MIGGKRKNEKCKKCDLTPEQKMLEEDIHDLQVKVEALQYMIDKGHGDKDELMVELRQRSKRLFKLRNKLVNSPPKKIQK